jgi:hypothetical protein
MSISRGALLLAVGLASLHATACGGDRIPAAQSDTLALEPGAVRQPIPAGIDPRMVEWRTDGVLIASRDSLLKTPGYVVDSIFPPEEALRRFLATVPEPAPQRLDGGEGSLDALLRAYWSGLVTRDSTALQRLAMTKAEFAHLYLPISAEVRAGMQPAIAWLMTEEASGRGLARALVRAEGRSTAVQGTTCSGAPVAEAGITMRGPCGVILADGAARDTLWIAGRVIERNGRFKLFSFANVY